MRKVIPLWAKKSGGRYWFKKPSVIGVKYSCGQCENINDITISTVEGEVNSKCQFCNTVNRFYIVEK
jgi:phage FluMu protein Com